MAELEVIIGGDSRDLAKEIDKVEKQLRELTAQKRNNIKLGLDNSEVILQINQAKKELKGYTTQLNSTANASQNFSKATANGSNTLTQFSRIAQDAPFGIIGIGNNLTATAESFSNLSRSSGGAVNALKAVGSSLLGGGGVLLAISLVTTGLTYMSQSGLTVGDVFDKLSGKFDKVGQAMNDVAAEAAKNSSEEITGYKALVSVAQNVNTSMEKRLLAVTKLQKEYPAYFGNLSKEKILNGDVSSATKDLTQAIIAKAKAQAFANKIAEIAEQSLKNDLKAAEARKKLIDLEKELARAKNNTAAAQFGGASAQGAGVSGVIGAINTQKNLINDLINANKENARIMGIYTNEVNKATDASILLDKETPKKTKQAKQGNTNEPIIKFRSELQPITADQLLPFNNAINEALTYSLLEQAPVVIDSALLSYLEMLQDFNDQASEIINNGIANTFAGLGEAIGGALASGTNVLEAAGASLLSSLGGVLVQLGQLAIQTGVGILAVQTALKSLNPAVAIAAGVALIALGSAFKGKAAKIGNSGGSSGGGGGSTGRDYTSPASSVSTGGGSGFTSGSVVFEISGTSLIGVLSNSLDKNSRLGGTLGI